MPGRRGEAKTSQVILLSTLSLVVVLFDQFTKWAALQALAYGQTTPVIPNVFHLTLVENTGIAFGMLHRNDWLLTWLIPASILLLAYFAVKICRENVPQPNAGDNWFKRLRQFGLVQWGILLILGGAIGNWIDRLHYGAVIDFLDFRVWPVFNFADCAITTGVGLYILSLIRNPKGPS